MSSFINTWNQIEGSFADTASREKIESMAVMIASIVIAEEVPVLGEIQMALQLIDFIDPYGYNQALTRSTLNKLMQEQYTKIQTAQTAMANCFTTSDPTACADAKISSSDLAEFKKLPQSLQDLRVKSLSSWATPFPPEVNYPDMMLCTLATTPERMQDCKNDLYKTTYLDYFNKNAPAYQANAEEAEAQAAAQAAAGFSGNSTQDASNSAHKKKIVIAVGVAYVVIIIIVFLLASKVFKK